MTFRQAEDYLLGLELFGMRFGLDRMHKLMTVLGMPQRRFASIHVVGSNGKSSTVRMIAAILERHGLRTGSYTSPHLRSFAERIEVGERPLPEPAFAAAVARAAHAAELVNRTLPEDDEVTQFEALTAAAYHALASSGVEVAVIEAGLGGRYDATNVIPSKVQVLTNVGLEHTRWLGPTHRGHRAREARRGARPRGAGDRAARSRGRTPSPRRSWRRVTLSHVRVTEPWRGSAAAAGQLPARNFAVAVAAAARPSSASWVQTGGRARPRAAVVVPGRLEPIADSPLTLIDGAHNPDGALALAEALRGDRSQALHRRRRDPRRQGRRGDAQGRSCRCSTTWSSPARRTRGRCRRRRSSPSSAQLDGPPSEIVADPKRGARSEPASSADPVLATGSIYLIADLVAERHGARVSTL